MHFWIDKRSPQACIYSGSRARVAASLGTNSSNFGVSQLTAGRRIPRSATKSMVTPIHRFPTVECTRPHLYRNQSQQQQSPNSISHQTHNFHHLGTSAQHHSSSSASANQYSIHRVYNKYGYLYIIDFFFFDTFLAHFSFSSHTYSSQSNPVDTNNSSATGTTTNTTMISAISSRPSHHVQLLAAGSRVGGSEESQLLPTHLKFGMWASLVLATIFVTSAKFYLDHQGTGLEVLLFCAFSATFFLAACTISICRRPGPSREPSINTAHTIQTQTDQLSSVEPIVQNNYDAIAVAQIHHQQAIAPPPPYHIAILLPDNAKEQPDEAPPPSYDKIII
uniref:CSON015620 protein n=1 Tax=Culicoides sonorensis TaxID=179676 RepID=A0A336K6I0_CULSO